MNSVKEKLRKATFGKLKSLQRKLLARGIPCFYDRSVLSHEAGDTSFRLTFRAGSNGEPVLVPQLTIRSGGSFEVFDGANFELGIARLKELFEVHHAGNGQTCSSDTQHRTEGQASDSNGDSQDSGTRVMDADNQTSFSHEGDAK